MKETIKKVVAHYWPELEAGHHLPRFAEVVGIKKPPTGTETSTDWDAYYAVDLKLLKQNGKHDKTPIFESVPLPIPAGNDSMGLYAFPQVGTWVIIMFAYGSQAHPVIISVLPHNRKMPNVPENELLLQLNNKTFLRSTAGGNQRLVAESKMHVGNGTINLLAEVRQLASILKGHTHPHAHGESGVPSQAGDIANVESNVNSITE